MQLTSLDLNLLVVLDALLETRSVKDAAGRVALSPSATSHALTRLRGQLEDPLLVRAGKEMLLTPRAARLAPRVRAALEGLERALDPEEALDPGRLERTFELAATDLVELVLIRPLSTRLARESPGVNLYCRRMSAEVTTQLRIGGCDLALGVTQGLPDDIHSEVLYRDRFVCLLRRGHPALNRRWTAERYAALEHVLVSPRGGGRGVVDALLARHGLKRRVARTVSSFMVAPHLVAETDYVLTISERIAEPIAQRLGMVPRKPPIELEGYSVVMYWHRRHEEDPVHAWLRDELRRTPPEAPPL